MNEKGLLLASTSPRRRQMLAWIRDEFDMFTADINEAVLPDENAEDYVKRMARMKAEKATRENPQYPVILASDTIVVYHDQILGKPVDENEAQNMLTKLRGKIHTVLTAISIAFPESGLLITDCCVANVPMREYTDQEIGQYIQSGDPFDKAGAYAIQNETFHPVENFFGCFACVMGLPLCHVVRQLKKTGLEIADDPTPICLSQLSYACQVSSSVLSFTDHITCCH